MELVKEESKRKSEELEMLKRSMEERSSMPPPQYSSEPLNYGSQQSPYSNSASDDYIMDFSKPAGYKPPVVERRSMFDDESSTVVRRRSLDPKVLNEVSKPPVPSLPPPRRSMSRESSQGPPPVPSPVVRKPSRTENSMERQHSQLMEEIRRSANQRLMRSSDE